MSDNPYNHPQDDGKRPTHDEAKRAIDAIQPESAAGNSSSDAAQYDPNVGQEAGGVSEASEASHAGSEGNEALGSEKGGN